MDCPRCENDLEVVYCTGGRMLRCAECGGTAVTVEMLRRFAPKERIDALWRDALATHDARGPRCGGCEGALRGVDVGLNGSSVRLDVCPHCHLVWFDAGELHDFSPEREEPEAGRRSRDEQEAARWGVEHVRPDTRDEIWRVLARLEGLFA